MVLFAGTVLLIAFGKREKVLAAVYRVFGGRERYDDEKAAKVLQSVFAVFAVLELLNLVFAKTAAVPAVCIPAAILICYLSLLYMDRRCRKKKKDQEIMPDEEPYADEDGISVPDDESYGNEDGISLPDNEPSAEEEGVSEGDDESFRKEDGIPTQDDESYEKEETDDGRKMKNE